MAEEEDDGDCTVHSAVGGTTSRQRPISLRLRQNSLGTLSTPSLCSRLRPVVCQSGGLGLAWPPGASRRGTLPLGLGLVAENSDCVLAESAEVGTVPVMEEAIQTEAGVTSPVPEWVSEKLFVNSIWRKEGI